MKKTVCILTLLLISITAYSQQDKQMRNLDPGFVHTVYFWLNNPDSGDDQKQFEKAMKKFMKKSLKYMIISCSMMSILTEQQKVYQTLWRKILLISGA